MSGKGELLLPDVPRITMADVDLLLKIRADEGLVLVGSSGRHVVSNNSDIAACTEILRLAHLGAFVEAAIQDGSGQSARQISREAAQRWRERTGLLG